MADIEARALSPQRQAQRVFYCTVLDWIAQFLTAERQR
jgi:hypothetical protein